MFSKSRHHRLAFTLVEIMIVVGIIGLLAILVVPGSIRSRQLSQGRSLLNNARQVDAAIDRWAIETGKVIGSAVDNTAVADYIKDGKLKIAVASSKNISNVLSQVTIRIGNVGTAQVRIDSLAKTKLSAITDWGSY